MKAKDLKQLIDVLPEDCEVMFEAGLCMDQGEYGQIYSLEFFGVEPIENARRFNRKPQELALLKGY